MFVASSITKKLVYVTLFLLPLVLVHCASTGESTKDPAGTETEDPEARSIAVVNGKEIPVSSFREALPKNTDAKDMENEKCTKIIEALIQRELVYQAAQKEGIDKDPEVQKQVANGIEALKRQIYLNAVSEKRIKPQISVTEEEIKDFYEKNTKTYTAVPEVKARQIIMYNKADLLKVKRQIKNNEDFIKFAHEKSIDPFSAPFGGDLGWLKQGEYLPEVEKILFALPPGKVSEPFQTKYGYHIFLVNEKKLARIKPLDEVRDDIEKQLKNQKALNLSRDYVEQLKKDAAIQINESFLNTLCKPNETTPSESQTPPVQGAPSGSQTPPVKQGQ